MAQQDAAYLELPAGTSQITWNNKPGLCLTVSGLKRLKKSSFASKRRDPGAECSASGTAKSVTRKCLNSAGQ